MRPPKEFPQEVKRGIRRLAAEMFPDSHFIERERFVARCIEIINSQHVIRPRFVNQHTKARFGDQANV